MLRKGVVCTGGDTKYGRYLRRLHAGCRIFLYVNRIGVVAEGVVTSEWSGRANHPAVVWKGQEYTVGVKWVRKATPEQAVSSNELSRLGLRQIRITLSRVEAGVADKISERLPGGRLSAESIARSSLATENRTTAALLFLTLRVGGRFGGTSPMNAAQGIEPEQFRFMAPAAKHVVSISMRSTEMTLLRVSSRFTTSNPWRRAGGE